MPTSFFRSMAAAAAVGLATLTFLAPPAGAQEDPCYPPTAACATTTSVAGTPNPTLGLSDTTVVRGQTISATVGNFQAGSSGIITVASVEQQIGSFTMPASGSATVSITIPTSISLGAHTVFARGTTLSGAAGSAARGITVVDGAVSDSGRTISGSGSGSSLARTGFFLVPVTAVGVGLVAGGLALKRSGRRKRSAPAA
jgi:alpha-L-fucosidase